MPKYFEYKVSGYYLYFTSQCVVEAMHAHASDRALTRRGLAKFFIKKDGETEIAAKGNLSERELNQIQKFIKIHYATMFLLWSSMSDQGFYGEE